MKKLLTALILIMLLSVLFACTGNNFNDVVIEAADVAGVAEGEYTLVYSIKNYEKLLEKYPDMEIFVTAVDDKNNSITVTNNRIITVEKDRTYTVRIAIYATVNGEQAQKTKTFTVTAIKSDPEIILHVGNEIFRRYSDLKYNDSFDISLLPEVPDVSDEHGYYVEATAKKWTLSAVRSTEYKQFSQAQYNELIDVTQNSLTGIKKNVDIYAAYVCTKTPKTFSITFHNNEGTETATISKTYLSNINCPAYPTKAGCVFDGWYTEAGLTNRFNWNTNTVISDNYDLYAKWLPATDESVNVLYQYELKTDNEGYRYYLAKPLSSMSGAVILPNNNENIPVKGLSNNAFRDMAITSVTIPAQYRYNTYYAFKNCTSLTTVTFEEGSTITALDEGAFYNCSALSSITLPSSLTKIGVGCFEGCVALTAITLPNIYKIQSASFLGSGLISIAIPDTVTAINDSAFMDCASLTSVIISATSHLTDINANAFNNTSVTEITLPRYFLENNVTPFEGTTIIVHYHDA